MLLKANQFPELRAITTDFQICKSLPQNNRMSAETLSVFWVSSIAVNALSKRDEKGKTEEQGFKHSEP